MIHRNSLAREIKRLEIRIVELAKSLTKRHRQVLLWSMVDGCAAPVILSAAKDPACERERFHSRQPDAFEAQDWLFGLASG
jgi:hypothetical protein